MAFGRRVFLALVPVIAFTAAPPEASAQNAQPQPAPAVTVATAEQRPVTGGLTFTGRVVAVDKVDIRARVPGFLKDRKFQEGMDVKAGDLLFDIEPDTYEAQVAQRKADLASAEAQAENAKVQLQRAEQLMKTQNISEAVLDDRRAQARVTAAAVLQAQAALTQAEINLGYTRITAPISGRIGLSTFTVGALVGPESGALATVVSQDPIYVTFPVSQRQILDVREQAKKQGDDPSRAVIRLTLANGESYPQAGQIDFADVSVNQTTDTLTIRARFPNPDRVLVDGQFVRVRAEAEQPRLAIVIPQRAVLNDQSGAYVYTVSPDSKAVVTRVRLGPQQGADVVAEEGLKAGDKVIVDGIQRVRPGAPVDAAPVTAQPARG
ncbi:efflux RND transporter periplasmic adaptor subunit [Chelatococcus sp. SYSU_G07232]|uniref:Efflux RND transporter periplasmic adaptor subunit n=1 Tax=Chelatococcus albus TaxID=3047466 RepID=A0ABT7AJ21_9HYPH|nr:efflux RND transporter periplasmic adaptor subunit [Chelatococcus sp. SYSU_G07232]MDJ1159376.1 efflux RND transporter periplasmic adaptor subunit [Chelatococcus sp. SYSU_G07232]